MGQRHREHRETRERGEMNGFLIGLVLVLFGIYFSSVAAIGMGLLCLVVMLYSTKSAPVGEPAAVERKKTKHTVISIEPPEEPFIPQIIGNLPISGTGVVEPRGFLPLPEYGYSDPLERVFFGFPVKFWKK